MNTGAFGIIGIGIFILICGYIGDSQVSMFIAALILLFGFGAIASKSTSIDKDTGKPYYKCPNCGKYAGKEIPKNKQENGKQYKCLVCDYKW